jgi:hypothetical protein
MTKLFVALLASLITVACAEVRSSVTVSHRLPAPAGKTVAIVPYAPPLAMAADFQSYTAKLAAHLQARGYNVVAAPAGQSPGQTADYIAFFHYGVDGSTVVNELQSVTAPPTGSIITFGRRGPFGHGTRRIYTRTVILEIVERARFNPTTPATYLDARVYSGWVKSEGACATMAPVIDPMLTALFAEFPGANAVRLIDLPAGTASCGPHRYG